MYRVPSVSVDGRVDWSVPEGDPPQRLDRLMHREVDVSAARSFLSSHEDELPVCRSLHAAELGRRVGLALIQGRIERDVRDVLLESAGFPKADQDALFRGIVASFEAESDPLGAWAVVKPSVDAQNSRLSGALTERLTRRFGAVGPLKPETKNKR